MLRDAVCLWASPTGAGCNECITLRDAWVGLPCDGHFIDDRLSRGYVVDGTTTHICELCLLAVVDLGVPLRAPDEREAA